MNTAPKKGTGIVVISCKEDKGLYQTLARLGATVYESEYILTGVLRQVQQLLLDRHSCCLLTNEPV